jgi:hypothetical protein
MLIVCVDTYFLMLNNLIIIALNLSVGILNFIKIRWQITEIRVLGLKVLAETPCIQPRKT